jgi:hypothetical protein
LQYIIWESIAYEEWYGHDNFYNCMNNSMSKADNYQTRVNCVNNDYILPGLEFNGDGLCAFCQCYDEINTEPVSLIAGKFITDEELINACKGNSSRFDVMALYTGGKDSSFLIWYLAKKLGLRVLVCMWDMPFSNPIVYENLKRAKERLPEVEFLTRALTWDMTKSGMQAFMKKFGVPCICQIISYPLFYAVACNEKIPFIIDGVETAQLFVSKTMTFLSNNQKLSDKEKIGNMVFKKEQAPITEFEMFLEEGKNHFEAVFEPCKEVLKNSKQEKLPQLVRFNTEDFYDTWNDIEGVISKELGWQPPPKQKGRLHTSCSIEKYEDYAQYQLFKQIRDMYMPMSIIEISSAVYLGQITREQGLQELSERGYYGKPECMKTLLEKLDLTESDLPYQCV